MVRSGGSPAHDHATRSCNLSETRAAFSGRVAGRRAAICGTYLWPMVLLGLLVCGCSQHEMTDAGRCNDEISGYFGLTSPQPHGSFDGCVSPRRPVHGVVTRQKPRQDDLQKEVSVFMPQAKAGNPEAAYRVGLIYERHGQQTTANGWLTKAADEGSGAAAMHLGRLYEASDPDAAIRWYDDAASHGEDDAGAREAAVRQAQDDRRGAGEKPAANTAQGQTPAP
jgi:hypothetical protein